LENTLKDPDESKLPSQPLEIIEKLPAVIQQPPVQVPVVHSEKIYESDPYLKSFSAKIVEILEKDEKFYIRLDATAFYPGGGGQESDRGTLNGQGGLAKVVDLYEKEGDVWHVCELSGAFSADQEVEGLIDWKRRHTMMKSHTAEHILFHCFQDVFKGIDMVKVHISSEGSAIFVKYGGELDMDGVIRVEKSANTILAKELPVTVTEYKKDQLPQGTRVKLERIDSDTVRVVQIGNFDSCACAGLHVKNTIEIGILTISNVTSEGIGQYKITFLVGEDAQDYLIQTRLACDRACSILQTTSDKLERTTVNLKAQKEKLEQTVKSLSERILEELQPAKLGDHNFYSKAFTSLDDKKLMARAGELIKTGRTVVLFCNKEGDKGFLLIAKSQDTFLDIKPIADKTFAMMNGKGGGPDNFISGAGDADKMGKAFGFAEEELTAKLSG
jgi:alanyl-tRNA synthetase